MPEGDTVFRTAQRLADALTGRVLTGCDIRVPRFATVDLTGERVDDVVARGKHLFIRVGWASIHSHLKMDGSWRVVSTQGSVPTWDHRIRAVLTTTDSVALGISLGVLDVVERRRENDIVGHLGPDLLGADWNPSVALERLMARADDELSATLLDQRVMAGIGNVYCNELCFLAGLLPTTPVRGLADPARFVERAHALLDVNKDNHRRTTTGDPRPGRELWVYGRHGKPCRRCGTRISRDQALPRVAYWCPSCQR
ncbi:endonuclease VIII Nei2 [Mycobacteroides salmoniphilum]|uniref:DNA-(apurinic or apyrimidinic site) lyase n=1 Tax=Mycobacteroides salmoniphilum TaxID=404941 RepID=A0A4R8SIR6_9MYCO|nr:endonuclease VIII Nei2 [Mycobacteroides salmoniphilum]TDZ96719.1 Endonuclease 8 [Mycobacteroides salmoniphilum]TEA05814.1 Endonuclease 8 [Mycobacteroides salmoniphilum]